MLATGLNLRDMRNANANLLRKSALCHAAVQSFPLDSLPYRLDFAHSLIITWHCAFAQLPRSQSAGTIKQDPYDDDRFLYVRPYPYKVRRRIDRSSHVAVTNEEPTGMSNAIWCRRCGLRRRRSRALCIPRGPGLRRQPRSRSGRRGGTCGGSPLPRERLSDI